MRPAAADRRIDAIMMGSLIVLAVFTRIAAEVVGSAGLEIFRVDADLALEVSPQILGAIRTGESRLARDGILAEARARATVTSISKRRE